MFTLCSKLRRHAMSIRQQSRSKTRGCNAQARAKKLGLKRIRKSDFAGKYLLPRVLRKIMKDTSRKNPSTASGRPKG